MQDCMFKLSFTRTQWEMWWVWLCAAANVPCHGPGPYPNHQARKQTYQIQLISIYHIAQWLPTSIHMLPGEVRIAHSTNVWIIGHRNVPLVEGLIIADGGVFIPNVGWHPCYFVIHEGIFQIKFRPVNIWNQNFNYSLSNLLTFHTSL